MRGPLASGGPLAPRGVPISRSRAQRFDDLVLDVIDRLERRFPDDLNDVEFAVEDVPPSPAGSGPDGDADGLGDDEDVPLGEVVPRHGDRPTRVVVYRRPIELRSAGQRELAMLVSEVVIEQVAELLALPPDEVDPSYDED